jgi:hypothetical protein
MFKWQEVPIQNLSDVLNWHRHQLVLAQNRFASRRVDPRYQGFPRQIKRMESADQKKIDFHQAVVKALEEAAASIGQAQADATRAETLAWELGATRT